MRAEEHVLRLCESNLHKENWVSIQELAGSVGVHRRPEVARSARGYSHQVNGCR